MAEYELEEIRELELLSPNNPKFYPGVIALTA